MARTSRCAGRAAIRGRLYEAGPCPAAIRDVDSPFRVHGEVWELPEDCSEIIAALDIYEECSSTSPHPHPYRRTKIRVRLQDGRRVTAWFYQWALDAKALALVADGRWREPSPAYVADPMESMRLRA
jgi:gamma-glutamylcyclotransferase (GGCT)/AIG2-like uncharacterized protein YtfP